MRVIEVKAAVSAEVIAVRAEVIVDDIEHHGDALLVRRIHERAQVVRRPVASCGRVEAHAVVAPVSLAGEIGDRHDLDRIHAEFRQDTAASPSPRGKCPPA